MNIRIYETFHKCHYFRLLQIKTNLEEILLKANVYRYNSISLITGLFYLKTIIKFKFRMRAYQHILDNFLVFSSSILYIHM